MLTSEGVASKRNFFEASAPSKAEPLTARKVRGDISFLGQIFPILDTDVWTSMCSVTGCCLDGFGGRSVVAVWAGQGSGYRNCVLAVSGFVFGELGQSQCWSSPSVDLLSLPVPWAQSWAVFVQ